MARNAERAADFRSGARDHSRSEVNTQKSVPERTTERATAYTLIASMLRLSVRRGPGWQCDDPFSSRWDLDAEIVAPYHSFTMIAKNVFAPPTDGLSLSARYPYGSESVADWSFVLSADSRVCAIDPDHHILFPDKSVWPLLDLAKTPPWRIGVSHCGADTDVKWYRPSLRTDLGPQPLFSSRLTDHDLYVHEAFGGRVIDHEIFAQHGAKSISRSSA